MIQDSNQLPPGKMFPEVEGKAVIDLIGASISPTGRLFNVVLKGGSKAFIPESALLDEPKKEEK